MTRHVHGSIPADEPGQLAGRRVHGTLGEHAEGATVQDSVAPQRVPNDVVVEDCVDGPALPLGAAGVQARTHQTLLLGDEAHEDQGRVEVETALTEDPGGLHGEDGAAPVVVGAGGRVVVDRPVEALPGDAGYGVVVSADVDPALAPPRENRHHVAELRLFRDAPLRLHAVAVQAHVQPIAEALHGLEDVRPSREDAEVVSIGEGQRVAGLEARQGLQVLVQPFRRDLLQKLPDAGIHALGRGGKGGDEEGGQYREGETGGAHGVEGRRFREGRPQGTPWDALWEWVGSGKGRPRGRAPFTATRTAPGRCTPWRRRPRLLPPGASAGSGPLARPRSGH